MTISSRVMFFCISRQLYFRLQIESIRWRKWNPLQGEQISSSQIPNPVWTVLCSDWGGNVIVLASVCCHHKSLFPYGDGFSVKHVLCFLCWERLKFFVCLRAFCNPAMPWSGQWTAVRSVTALHLGPWNFSSSVKHFFFFFKMVGISFLKRKKKSWW